MSNGTIDPLIRTRNVTAQSGRRSPSQRSRKMTSRSEGNLPTDPVAPMGIQAALVRSILEKWQHYDWTIQGFGFVRTKIANVGRIHVWDSRLSVPLVSTAHTHPWQFRSTIISGELLNQRFGICATDAPCVPYMRSRIATGEGGGLLGDPEEVLLAPLTSGYYTAGLSYMQLAEDIHRTVAQDGTVTLLERQQGPPLEEAFTFWPRGTQWVSAEPRLPKGDWEIAPVMDHALARWAA